MAITAAQVTGDRMLGTADQIAAEAFASEVLGLAETKAIWSRLRQQLLDDPAMKTTIGPETLDRSLTLWTNFLAIREYAGDPDHPRILWVVENAAHEWGGVSFRGSAAAGDNPDNIYRGAFIDGASSYEISGFRPPDHATQFSIEVTRGGPGRFILVPQSAKTPDLGDQVALLSDRDIQINADGTFLITLSTAPGNGRPNHITLEPGSQSINFRDSLSNWALRPYGLSIRRVSGPPGRPAWTREERIRRTLEDMPEFVLFWARFNRGWLGRPPVNTLPPPAPRDGGWGYLCGGYYDVAPDEAIIVTTHPGDAQYTGMQIANPWMVADDGSRTITSRNMSQLTPNADGTVTYVISTRDRGAPNWIDMAGLRQGILLARWQKITPVREAAQLLRDFQIVKVDETERFLPSGTRLVTPADRQTELAKRKQDYDLRLDY